MFYADRQAQAHMDSLEMVKARPAGWDKAFDDVFNHSLRSRLLANPRVVIVRDTIFAVPLVRKLRKLVCSGHNVVTRRGEHIDSVACIKCGRLANTKEGLIFEAQYARRNWWKLKTWRTL